MELKEIISTIEALAPATFQESYDNSGLILGSPNDEISKVLVCLDADQKALDFAIQQGCELILSHHPVIFKAIKSLADDTREGTFFVKSIKHDIAIYSAHTNFDSAIGGLSDMLCKRIGLRNINILKKAFSIKEDHGFGRYGDITPMSGEQFISMLKAQLSVDVVRLVGAIPESISKVAVCNGSYDRDVLKELCALKPDAFLTGDLKYHDAQELLENGIFTIDAGHYGTEKLFVEEMSKLLETPFPDLKVLRYEGEDVYTYHL